MCCSGRRSGSTDIRVASVALVTHGSTLVMSRYHDATVSKHIKNKTTTAGTCWGLIVVKGFEVLGYRFTSHGKCAPSFSAIDFEPR